MKRIITITLVCGLFLSVPLFIRAQSEKWTLSLFAGINHVQEYGSVDDYILGENDFPVTPSHAPVCIGAGLGYSLLKGLRFEIDARYHLSSNLTLEDPSDQDHVSFDSAKHVAFTGNFIYEFLSGNIRPYLAAGFGIDFLSGVEEQTVESELGYEITLLPPEDKSDFLINGGGGVVWMFSPRIGARLDARYLRILKSNEIPAISSFNWTVGLVFRF